LDVLKQVSLTVNGELQALDRVLSAFDQLNQPWIPRKDWLQSQLALAEGFTNAVRHAHRDLPSDTTIEIQMSLRRDSLTIQIWDQGPPFDLEGFLQRTDAQDNQLAGHGQGLPILQKIAAELRYLRQGDRRNCLVIVKEFSFI
jgi:serine/threonine-protein kinase RsbW